MSEATPAVGQFVWYDLMSVDVPVAESFYQKVFGWTVKPVVIEGIGTVKMLYAGEQAVGDIIPFEASHGYPSHWVPYLSVEDVDAVVGNIKAIGGAPCVPPMDIPNIGRFALVNDPTGAIFSPFRAFKPDTEAKPDGPPAVGTFCWNELLTNDVAGAASFYDKLFGWNLQAQEMEGIGTYHVFQQGEQPAAGLMQMPEEEALHRPMWVGYVVVDDCDATAAAFAENGGTVLVPPMDVVPVGRIAMASDPGGAVIAFMKPE